MDSIKEYVNFRPKRGIYHDEADADDNDDGAVAGLTLTTPLILNNICNLRSIRKYICFLQ